MKVPVSISFKYRKYMILHTISCKSYKSKESPNTRINPTPTTMHSFAFLSGVVNLEIDKYSKGYNLQQMAAGVYKIYAKIVFCDVY